MLQYFLNFTKASFIKTIPSQAPVTKFHSISYINSKLKHVPLLYPVRHLGSTKEMFSSPLLLQYSFHEKGNMMLTLFSIKTTLSRSAADRE